MDLFYQIVQIILNTSFRIKKSVKLTLFKPIDFPFHIRLHTIKSGWVHCIILGSQVIISKKKKLYIFSDDGFCLSKQCRS